MYSYTAFGLNIKSDLVLPNLLTSESKQNDVYISIGTVSKTGLVSPNRVLPFSQQADNKHWLHIPDIAWFLITDGNKIVVEPEKNADEESIRLFLLGTCIGAIMHQRSQLVIHGNAIRFGDECVIFAGDSGNGKSTLAAAFHKRGYQILADDLAVIDEKNKVQPSYPQMKLWHDTAKKLNIDISKLLPVRPQIKKYNYPIKESFCNTPLPVKAIYILRIHNQDEFLFEPIKGVSKFNPLKNNTYRMKYLDGFGLKPQHLKLCSQLANEIDITRIIRPDMGFKLEELVELIEADLKTKETEV